MNPFGQFVKNPQRAVLLLIDEHGDQHGWEVFNGHAEYQILGYPDGSAHARVQVTGEFHRMKRAGTLHPLEDPEFMGQIGTRQELEGPHD